MMAAEMTDNEAIAAARRGDRVVTRHTLHSSIFISHVASCAHRFRTVACNNESDVIECSRCGWQQISTCNFDEEFS